MLSRPAIADLKDRIDDLKAFVEEDEEDKLTFNVNSEIQALCFLERNLSRIKSPDSVVSVEGNLRFRWARRVYILGDSKETNEILEYWFNVSFNVTSLVYTMRDDNAKSDDPDKDKRYSYGSVKTFDELEKIIEDSSYDVKHAIFDEPKGTA